MEKKKLGDLVRIKNGKDYKHLDSGNYPVYGTGGVMTYVNQYAYDKPTVLIPRKGSLDRVYYVDEPFWNVDTIFYTEINEKQIIPKYLYYYLDSLDLNRYNTAGGIPSLTQKKLNTFKIPTPPLDKQKEIVSILDQFECLIKYIEKELDLRQKQFEYYRNKLLSE